MKTPPKFFLDIKTQKNHPKPNVTKTNFRPPTHEAILEARLEKRDSQVNASLLEPSHVVATRWVRRATRDTPW